MSHHFYPFDHAHDTDDPTQLAALLGGKGAGLAAMTGLGIPVPPGFTIPTGACLDYLADGWTDALDQAVAAGIAGIEQAVGRRLGDATAPLLVSVRSGAAVSMPGMMDTVLDVGMSSELATALARQTGDADFAWDTYQRSVASFVSVVGGASDEEIAACRAAATTDPGPGPEQRARAFVEALRQAGHRVPDDPFGQVAAAVEAVFRSWRSDRAEAYRRLENIDDDIGTAATVQAMVFGNLGPASGTGVAFSRDPSSGEKGLMGDFLARAQGEDVVAGTHATMALTEMKNLWPAVFTELESVAGRVEHHLADMVDLEFTVENGRLWLLQARRAKRSPAAVFRTAVEMAEDPAFPLDRAEAVERCRPLLDQPPTISSADGPDEQPGNDQAVVLAVGLAASPGQVSGVLSLDPDDALARSDQGDQVILVRQQTSPADVHGIGASVGLVTTLGGLVSHAAVVARSWGLAAVVGVDGITIKDDLVISGQLTVSPGEVVTVDGDNGRFLLGDCCAGAQPLPEVATIKAWDRELGSLVDRTAPAAATPSTTVSVTLDDGVRLTALKGMISAETVVTSLGAAETDAAALVAELVEVGLATEFAGGKVMPTPEATTRVEMLFATERAGRESSFGAVLDQFHQPNTALKEVVTAWQVRPIDGAEVANDHDDHAYDSAILTRLRSEVHGAVGPVVDQAAGLLERLGRYRVRLDAALDRLDDGDHRYVAHPLLDSYHTVWFELHEELIRLAGRDRLTETEAGRA